MKDIGMDGFEGLSCRMGTENLGKCDSNFFSKSILFLSALAEILDY